MTSLETHTPIAFVTGATGLVGAHLTAALLLQGYHVRALRRKTSNLSQFHFILSLYGLTVDECAQQLSWAEADLFDSEAMQQALTGADFLFHCAADVNLAAVSEEQMLKTNVQGTKQLLFLAKRAGVQKLCYMSSIAALGNSVDGVPIDELTIFDGTTHRSAYGRSKIAAEAEVMKADAEGLSSVIVCPGVILGPTNKNESSAQILFLAKKGMPVIASGGSGYVDVRDVCRAMIALMESPIHGERFVVVGANIRLSALFKLMSDGFNHRAPLLLPDWVILTAGSLSGWVGQLLRRTPAFDRQMAQTSINFTTYSSAKLIKTLSFEFTPIEQTVHFICESMK